MKKKFGTESRRVPDPAPVVAPLVLLMCESTNPQIRLIQLIAFDEKKDRLGVVMIG